MAHTPYENFVLENKIEDFLSTKLDINNFLTVDTSLTEHPGMTKKIHVYSATGDVEELAMGQGNSEDIEVAFTPKEYEVGTTQGRFPYYDEEEMTDPMVVETGLRKLSDNMVNDLTTKAIAEFNNAPNVVNVIDWSFESIVDALAQYPYENEDNLFLLINAEEKAEFRKALNDDLKYVEDFARKGYIGTVCGVPVYISKAVPADTAFLATKEAITAFIKKGVEIEQERDANTRKNTVYARKVAVVALTDESRAIKIVKA